MVATTLATSASGALSPSMTATAAALPTGGARVARINPSARSSAVPARRASSTTSSGTPSVAQTSSRPSSAGRAASAWKAGPSTLRKAPRVKQKTARPTSGRANAARGGQDDAGQHAEQEDQRAVAPGEVQQPPRQ
jgi:hypothetical protein